MASPKSPSSIILLKGGTLLVPKGESDATIVSVKKDLLIVDDNIASIGNINAPTDKTMTVIDCSHKIISPGFIDTHHHLWQTQLKGRHGDHTVLGYMPTGNLTASFFTPGDIFWGQLGGAMEALDSGTTTVVDHAHMNYSKQHSNHALAATLTAGIRSVFCYTPTPCVKSWQPRLELTFDLVQTWHFEQISHFATLLAKYPSVSLGFGFDGYNFLGPDATRSLFARIRAANVRPITSHYFRNPLLSSGTSVVETMAELGILSEDVIISHATGLTSEEKQLMANHGAFISCTPSSEMHQGLGQPALSTPAEGDDKSSDTTYLSLGCDSHSVVKGSMIEQMRLALSVGRMQRTQFLLEKNKFPRTPNPTVEEVFKLATMHGAQAIGREKDLGMLKVGYKADIVVWDSLSPNMVCAGVENPLTAIVCHADTRDINCVIVNGTIRKLDGQLVDCKIQGYDDRLLSEQELPKNNDLCWIDVAKALEQSRTQIQDRICQTHADGKDKKGGGGGDVEALIDAFGLNTDALVD